jgi:hypothetical protein
MLANARAILIAGAARGVSGVALSGDADAYAAPAQAISVIAPVPGETR